MIKNKVRIITIAGGTASGKTTTARKISQSLKTKSIVRLPMDSYYKNYTNVTPEEKKAINFDHPDSIDINYLLKHIKDLMNGKSVEMPVYDFSTSSRKVETITKKPGSVIILDGVLALAMKEIRKISDVKIFIKTEDDIRFIRRLQRDISERNRTIENVIKQYEATVKPMHDAFVEPSIKYADIIVPYYNGNNTAIELIKTHIQALLD